MAHVKGPVSTHFNPRAPCGARQGKIIGTIMHNNFNPRAPCGARRADHSKIQAERNFNPRAPCGARPQLPMIAGELGPFQPTRPLRGATIPFHRPKDMPYKISTHAPLAGRDPFTPRSQFDTAISTHAPLAGRDVRQAHFWQTYCSFQPTRPLRGATVAQTILRR